MGISSELLALALVAAIFGGVLYWIFIMPERALKRRREAINAQGGYFRTWDPDLLARKRHR